MRILVTFAVDAEFAPWRKLREFRKIESEVMECFTSQINRTEVCILLTGIGRKKAVVESTKVIWGSDVDFCISSGLAGALRVEHSVGDILVAEFVRGGNSQNVSSDPRLIESAVHCGAKKVDSFISVEDVMVRAEDKRLLGRRADAVEMESYGVMMEAAGWGGKVVAVRAISDGVDEDLPLDFNRVTTDQGDVSMIKVFGQIAQNPTSIPALVRFGKRSRIVAEKLAEFLERYVVSIAETNAVMAKAR